MFEGPAQNAKQSVHPTYPYHSYQSAKFVDPGPWYPWKADTTWYEPHPTIEDYRLHEKWFPGAPTLATHPGDQNGGVIKDDGKTYPPSMFVEGRPDLEYFGMGVDPPEMKHESVGTVATARHFHSDELWAGFDKNANDELDSLGRPLPFIAVFEDEIAALVEEFLWRQRRARWLGRLIPSLHPPPDPRDFIERDRDIRGPEVTVREGPREQRGMSASPNLPPPQHINSAPRYYPHERRPSDDYEMRPPSPLQTPGHGYPPHHWEARSSSRGAGARSPMRPLPQLYDDGSRRYDPLLEERAPHPNRFSSPQPNYPAHHSPGGSQLMRCYVMGQCADLALVADRCTHRVRRPADPKRE